MDGNRPELVPASLVRMRRFMCGTGGLVVKPWATSPEVLDAFHDLLVARRGDERFWQSLRSLLADMSGDVARRASAGRGHVVDNEILDPARMSSLLAEIRTALDRPASGRGAFRRLASALSVPSAGLLLVLGGVVTLGCESSQRIEGDADSAADAPADTPLDTAADTAADTPDDVPPDTALDPAADPGHDPPGDDADCGADAACPHGCETLEQILEECVPDPGMRQSYLDCIGSLHDSWSTGLTALFACEDCGQVSFHLGCCLTNGATDICGSPSTAGEFDLDAFLDNCGCYLYLAVRFD